MALHLGTIVHSLTHRSQISADAIKLVRRYLGMHVGLALDYTVKLLRRNDVALEDWQNHPSANEARLQPSFELADCRVWFVFAEVRFVEYATLISPLIMHVGRMCMAKSDIDFVSVWHQSRFSSARKDFFALLNGRDQSSSIEKCFTEP
jgi:hypothetical protein